MVIFCESRSLYTEPHYLIFTSPMELTKLNPWLYHKIVNSEYHHVVFESSLLALLSGKISWKVHHSATLPEYSSHGPFPWVHYTISKSQEKREREVVLADVDADPEPIAENICTDERDGWILDMHITWTRIRRGERNGRNHHNKRKDLSCFTSVYSFLLCIFFYFSCRFMKLQR